MGYSTDLFTTDIDPMLICEVCHDVVKEVTQCKKCETLYCMDCILKWMQTNQTCPHCRNYCILQDPGKILRGILGKLVIQCQLCPQTVSLANFQKHMKNKCNIKMQIDAQLQEQASCTCLLEMLSFYQPDSEILYKHLYHHFIAYPEFNDICKQCGFKKLKKETVNSEYNEHLCMKKWKQDLSMNDSQIRDQDLRLRKLAEITYKQQKQLSLYNQKQAHQQQIVQYLEQQVITLKCWYNKLNQIPQFIPMSFKNFFSNENIIIVTEDSKNIAFQASQFLNCYLDIPLQRKKKYTFYFQLLSQDVKLGICKEQITEDFTNHPGGYGWAIKSGQLQNNNKTIWDYGKKVNMEDEVQMIVDTQMQSISYAINQEYLGTAFQRCLLNQEDTIWAVISGQKQATVKLLGVFAMDL